MVVSFDDCPGESRGDFFCKKALHFLNFSAYYIWARKRGWIISWRSPGALGLRPAPLKKRFLFFGRFVILYIWGWKSLICKRRDTYHHTAPPPRYIGSRNHNGRQHIARHTKKTKKEFPPAAEIFLFHIYYARGASPARRGDPQTPPLFII